MKRKLLSVILSFLFVFSMAISVSASADGIEDGSTTISPRAHDVEAKRELVNTQTLVKHPIGYAKGQPSNGTVFPSYGECLCRLHRGYSRLLCQRSRE